MKSVPEKKRLKSVPEENRERKRRARAAPKVESSSDGTGSNDGGAQGKEERKRQMR